MADDALWYEAANVVGITNALNVVADGLAPAHAAGLFAADDLSSVSAEAAAVLGEIRDFYARDDIPLAFRLLIADAGYLADVWGATRRAFSEARLPRRLKESLAFAVSLTTRSAFGTTFHLCEMRRLGVSERGVLEVLGVAQMFSSYTKIADTLQLEPDMGDIAPVDRSPVPGAGSETLAAPSGSETLRSPGADTRS
jgi:alkylhydroperoxidase/carboxymuconolactone decarboxylase family protein YurZ